MEHIIGEAIKARLEAIGMPKAELARRLHMSPANVHKIFKRTTVDVKLLQKLSDILDYDFFRHFAPEVTRQRREPETYNIGDTEVLFIRYVVDLQKRVQILEQRWDTFKPSAKVEAAGGD